MVLYIADTNVNAPWTQTCISQADCILLVGVAEGSPAIGEYERFLLGMKTTARKELVLLHAERYGPNGLSRQWLKNRMWINGGHHHIQMASRLTAEPTHPVSKRFGTALKQRVQVIQAEIQKVPSRRVLHQTPLYSASSPFKGHFTVSARRLCGKSIRPRSRRWRRSRHRACRCYQSARGSRDTDRHCGRHLDRRVHQALSMPATPT